MGAGGACMAPRTITGVIAGMIGVGVTAPGVGAGAGTGTGVGAVPACAWTSAWMLATALPSGA